MIKIPNYNVVVPITPDLTLNTHPRTSSAGERNHLEYELAVTNATQINLPWTPLAINWVEVYNNGVRIVNPRITSISGGDLFEVFNVRNKVITFNTPITGTIKVICDTQPIHFWGSLILNSKNVQGFYVYEDIHQLLEELHYLHLGSRVDWLPFFKI